MRKEWVISSQISIGRYKNFVNEVFRLAQSSSYICFANVHMIVEAHRDKSFGKILEEADIVAPDGKPISIFLRWLKRIPQERVCGMDFLPTLLKEAEARNKSVYFYGTTDETLTAIEERCKKDFPLLKLAGFYSPPFRQLSTTEKDEIVQMINSVRPDLVFVALGCPKQEKWMAEHKGKINSCMLGVGQAFQVFAGKEKRLPKWMRDLSLEWAYRLYLEPGRLWKRYLVTNSFFVFLTLRELVAGNRHGR